MKPSRPYILKALYDWLLDSELTPHLLVDAENGEAIIPVQFVENGQIVLNINPSAVRNFYVDDLGISFNARFSGQPMDIFVPMSAILAIYARENGQGMGFGAEPGAEAYLATADESEAKSDEGDEAPVDKSSRPALKVVK
ncbi:ClpXP protease specificity-enhancing factor [uncultured Neptuniibacter sp.]|uniref:ClpXP protease specificity-enhancing factor n=1 Tax=uncultured Neptuniibacter sp. TaxID=502143 RepID=UPI0026328A54|nr:ClpXP protease specificity-enhancing factor [uncultured Neptuniibacter sp.]